MFTTGGRGFEVPYASVIWGVIIVFALALWLWTKYDIRKHGGRKDDDDPPKE